MKLNTEKWQDFKLSSLFEMKNGFFNNKPETIDSVKTLTSIPFLGATAENNGITDYCDIESIRSSSRTGDDDDTLVGKIFDGNCITITNNGSVCHAYFQPKQFTSSHDETICVPKFNLNMPIAMFICSIINKERYKWSYGRKLHDIKKSKNIVIKLPIQYMSDGSPVIDKEKKYNNNGYIPDWQFMEMYIKSLYYKPLTTKRAHKQKPPLNVSEWEDFCVVNLFDKIYKGKAYTDEDLYGIVGLNVVPYITRTDLNNGCKYLAVATDDFCIEEGNAISIGDTTATCFYQKERFITGDHMVVLRAKWLNLTRGLFVVCLFNKERLKYSYGRSYKMDNIKKTIFKLPIQRDSNGKPIINKEKRYNQKGYIPDWQFMEDYINSLPYSDRLSA